jgi:zinc protease
MYDRVPHFRSFRYWAVPGWTAKDRVLLTVAASVLGEGKNSRLYRALVYELQLASALSVQVQPLELASLFSIDATLAEGATIEQVDDIIEQELKLLLRDGPREEEVQRAKTRILSDVVRGLERIGGFSGKATTLAQSALYDGEPGFFKTELNWINNATAEEVRDAASRWLAGGRYQLDVKPFGEYQTAAQGVDRGAGLPEVGELPELNFPEIQRASLENGMNVILAQWEAVPVVSIALQFDAGYAADAGREAGTSSLTLAMMDESTRSRSALEIDAEAELLGARISSQSNLDTSTVSLSAMKSALQASIELFADVILNPAFSADELERLRARWLAAIEREKNDPVDLALRTLPPLIYGAHHAYGIPFTGTGRADSINRIGRQQLLQFHSDWIRPDNATVIVVGDVSMDEILPLLERNFGDWQAPKHDLPTKNIGQATLPQRARVIIIDKPGSSQSMILAAHLAPPSGVANNIELEMMNDVIGGVYAARVNQNLRVDKGWT